MRYLALLLFTMCSYAQNTFHDAQFDFSIQEPARWIKAEKNESLANLREHIKLSAEKIDKMIANNKGTIEIVTFYKYSVDSVSGIIPTIKVNLRKNPAKTITDFKKLMENSIASIKTMFPKMKITKVPAIVKVGGRDCIYFESLNVIPTKSGDETVRTLTYSVPVGTNFFQINFMDTVAEDNQALFAALLKTIKL